MDGKSDPLSSRFFDFGHLSGERYFIIKNTGAPTVSFTTTCGNADS